ARVLKLVDSPRAWDRPITKAVIVERLARRYLAEGKAEDLGACASLLRLAPTAAERERLLRAMEQQMDGLHLPKAPAGLAAALKDKARDVLVSRAPWSAALLDAVARERVPAKDFRLEQVRLVLLHKDAKLTERVEKLWGQVRPASSREKQGRIMAVSQIVSK